MLAASFAIGYVVFNVGGSGNSGGIADLIAGQGSGSSGPSVESAQERVDEHPRDPAALRALATALQNDGKPDEAIPILERYSQVRAKDVDVLNELAGLYQSRAARLRGEAVTAQQQAQAAVPETDILPASTTPLGKALGTPPITEAVSAAAQQNFNAKLTAMQAAYRQAQQVYERIVVLEPEDAAAQQELGYAALYANDSATAISAFKRFLELAPDDAEAPLIRQQLKQLESSSSQTTASSNG